MGPPVEEAARRDQILAKASVTELCAALLPRLSTATSSQLHVLNATVAACSARAAEIARAGASLKPPTPKRAGASNSRAAGASKKRAASGASPAAMAVGEGGGWGLSGSAADPLKAALTRMLGIGDTARATRACRSWWQLVPACDLALLALDRGRIEAALRTITTLGVRAAPLAARIVRELTVFGTPEESRDHQGRVVDLNLLVRAFCQLGEGAMPLLDVARLVDTQRNVAFTLFRSLDAARKAPLADHILALALPKEEEVGHAKAPGRCDAVEILASVGARAAPQLERYARVMLRHEVAIERASAAVGFMKAWRSGWLLEHGGSQQLCGAAAAATVVGWLLPLLGDAEWRVRQVVCSSDGVAHKEWLP